MIGAYGEREEMSPGSFRAPSDSFPGEGLADTGKEDCRAGTGREGVQRFRPFNTVHPAEKQCTDRAAQQSTVERVAALPGAQDHVELSFGRLVIVRAEENPDQVAENKRTQDDSGQQRLDLLFTQRKPDARKDAKQDHQAVRGHIQGTCIE